MSDIIWDYTFNNVLTGDFPGGLSPLTISGKIEVDYTTGQVTGLQTSNGYGLTATSPSLKGTYHFTFPAGSTSSAAHYDPANDSNTGFTLNEAHGAPYNDGLNLIVSGTGSATLTGGTLIINHSIYDNSAYQFVVSSPSSVTATQVCFASGARIRTPGGDVPVQALRAGDTVVTASGERRRIKWTGRRTVRRDFSGRRVDTVRIAAHAFGDNRPSRDLVVSPTHSICVDCDGEVLIPAARLVNGATITLEPVDRVTWHHVELDSHDILLAENLPAESYLDMGNRGFFEEAGATMDSLEDGADRSHADFCRPFVDSGARLDRVRDRLLDRARDFGWTPQREANLRLVVDGETLTPATRPGRAVFVLPAEATDVRLVSDTFRPAALGYDDARTLGVPIRELVFSTLWRERRVVAPAHKRLRRGVHPVEKSGALSWRWTDGALVLDPALWAGLSGPLILSVAWDDNVMRGWNAPVVEERRIALAA